MVVLLSASAEVLLVCDLLQPLDRLAVLQFLNRDVRHGGFVGRAVPMLLAKRTGNDIARPYFLFRLAPALCPSKPGGDDQCLTARMRVPRAARTGVKRDACAAE